MNNTEKRLSNAGWLSVRWVNIHIEVLNTKNVMVWASDNDGDLDPEMTDTVTEMIIESLDTETSKWGGFKTAGGWWYLEKNYDSKPLEAAYRDQMGGAR